METTEIAEIVRRSKEYCDTHGLRFAYYEPDMIVIGQSGFNINNGACLADLPFILALCKVEHEEINKIKWTPGILQTACGHINGDTVIISIIESELAMTLNKNTLDDIARVLYKHTRNKQYG